MFVEEILSLTVLRLETLPPGETARAAANALGRQGIGLLVVGGGPIVGVVSKSDLIRYLANGGNGDDPIRSIMTTDVVTCYVTDDLKLVWNKMLDRKLQNLPVIDKFGTPLGVVDLDDLLATLLRAEVYEEQLLINYVAGLGYQ